MTSLLANPGDTDPDAADICRLLAAVPWLYEERHALHIEMVHRHAHHVRLTMTRLGWRVIIERDLVRLIKGPAPRPDVFVPTSSAPTATWFWLFIAAIDALPSRVGLPALVESARAAAAEVSLPVTGTAAELQSMLNALHMLINRGLMNKLEGDLQTLLTDQRPAVLLQLHHMRILHLISPRTPDAQPRDAVAERVMARLVDETAVLYSDLNTDEEHWLRTHLHDEVAATAEAFGLHIEERTEGVALIVDREDSHGSDTLGPHPFPRAHGTVAHAAVLMRDHVLRQSAGDADPRKPGPGWRSVPYHDVLTHLKLLAKEHTSWANNLRACVPSLAERIRELWQGLDMLRITEGFETTWWFSPAAARWDTPPPPLSPPEAKDTP
ncbi:DUF2398 family protein [Streptomyces sp. NPDC057445]|uniref:DUF2398 family protein n=1 Tax=Streptomyces sp. NPDC057445 TaxID=3346136 RepID=UPI00368CD4A1